MPKSWHNIGHDSADYTFVIINRNDLEHFHTIINPMNANIKFSREEEHKKQVPFLVILVQRHGDGKIYASVQLLI